MLTCPLALAEPSVLAMDVAGSDDGTVFAIQDAAPEHGDRACRAHDTGPGATRRTPPL
jgi:hypothetical protein